MARRQVTVEVDEDLLNAACAAAARLGIPEDQLFEQGLRKILIRDFDALMDRVAAHQREAGLPPLTDDEAMAIAVEEVRAVRAERRDAS